MTRGVRGGPPSAPGRPDRAGGSGRLTLSDEGQPGQDGHHRESAPDREAESPVTSQGTRHRHGHSGGDGRAEREGHRVETRHGADPVGEVALDDDRHQDVAEGDAHERESARGQEPGHRTDPGTHEQAQGDGCHAQSHHAGGAEAPGEPRSGDTEHGEAQGGNGSEHTGDGRAHVESVPHFLQQRAEAGDGGPQVARGQDQSGDEQLVAPPPGAARDAILGEVRGRVDAVAVAWTAHLFFVTAHDQHRRMMGCLRTSLGHTVRCDVAHGMTGCLHSR